MDDINVLLTCKGVRATPNRIAVMKVFLKDHRALSHARVGNLLGRKIDRASVFRALRDLSKAGILEKVMDSTGTALFHFSGEKQYALSDLHPHFKCKTCDQITALPELPRSYINMIANCGQVRHDNILLEGICLSCLQSES